MNQGLHLRTNSYICSIEHGKENALVLDQSNVDDTWNTFVQNHQGGDESIVNFGTEVNAPVKHVRDKKKHGNTNNNRKPLLPPCVVCGVTSTGFHYGANTCEACKGFFRRNSKKSAVLYRCKCSPEDQNAWTRGSVNYGCQACRFKRCLAVGMSKEAIKLGRYTYSHKTENIKRVKYIEALNGKTESFHSSKECIQSQVLATDNIIEPCYRFSPMKSPLRHIHLHANSMSPKDMDAIICQLTESYLNSIPAIETSLSTIKRKQSLYLEKYTLQQQTQTNIDFDGQRCQVANILKLFEDKVIKAVAFAKNIPGFRDLLLDDQASLIKASRVEMTLFGAHSYLVTHIDTVRMVITCPWGEEIHLDELNQLIPLNIVLLRCHFARRLTNLQLTSKEMSIFRAIITTASDRCELKEPKKVDALQQKLVTCLQYLLNIRSRGPGTLLYKIFSLMSDLRELTEIEAELSKKMLSDWPTVSKDNFYLLKELSS